MSDRIDARTYTAPALDKGLDILELLAGLEGERSLSDLAVELGRSKSELFRMVAVLHERGYLVRNPATDAYHLSNRLFELGLRTPRVKDLLTEAVPAMSRLAETSGHSPHLVVLHGGETVVIAAVPGRSDMSFTLKLGYRRRAIVATSGQVIIAHQRPDEQSRLITESRDLSPPTLPTGDLSADLARIRHQGYELHPSRDFVGITDICAPVLNAGGVAVASIIVSYVDRLGRENRHAEVLSQLRQTCQGISALLA